MVTRTSSSHWETDCDYFARLARSKFTMTQNHNSPSLTSHNPLIENRRKEKARCGEDVPWVPFSKELTLESSYIQWSTLVSMWSSSSPSSSSSSIPPPNRRRLQIAAGKTGRSGLTQAKRPRWRKLCPVCSSESPGWLSCQHCILMTGVQGVGEQKTSGLWRQGGLLGENVFTSCGKPGRRGRTASSEGRKQLLMGIDSRCLDWDNAA